MNVLEGRGAGGWHGAVLGCVAMQGPVLLLLALGPCSGCGTRAREIGGTHGLSGMLDVAAGTRSGHFWNSLRNCCSYMVEKAVMGLGVGQSTGK